MIDNTDKETRLRVKLTLNAELATGMAIATYHPAIGLYFLISSEVKVNSPEYFNLVVMAGLIERQLSQALPVECQFFIYFNEWDYSAGIDSIEPHYSWLNKADPVA